MRTELITAPPTEPVLLEEAKEYLRIDSNSDDVGTASLIVAARQIIEQRLGLALIDQTWALYLDSWPQESPNTSFRFGETVGKLDPGRPEASVSIPIRPLISISELVTRDGLGAETVWAAENYGVIAGLAPTLFRKRANSWPVPSTSREGIKITFIAGFGPDWNGVPADIRQALLMLIAHFYAHRGDSPARALRESGALELLTPYRKLRL